MTTPFTFSVAGTPRPQPRPRFVNGRAVSTASPKAKLWRAGVARAAKAAVAARGDAVPLFRGPVQLRATFTFAPPDGAPERIGTPHTLKPDASNLLKLVEDVMEDCGVFKNDSQISRGPPEKWWGSRPGVVIIVESMEGETRVDPVGWTRTRPDWLSP